MVSQIVDADKNYFENNNEYKFYSAEKLGIAALTLYNTNTGAMLATIHGNSSKRVASHIAWAGARHSRAPGDTIDILLEMQEKGIDPDQKLEETFNGFGHASVGDMARIAVQFNNVPMHLPLILFNDSYTNSGQEKSTRYQKRFSGAILHPLGSYIPDAPADIVDEYNALGELSSKNFNELMPLVTEKYTKYFNPQNSDERKSLTSRVLDTARFTLLLGQSSGFALETSAREWSRLISHLKASPTKYYQNIGMQIESILAPSRETENALGFKAEAPSLIRHTEPDNSVKETFKNIEWFFNELGRGDDFMWNISDTFRGLQHQRIRLIDNKYTIGDRMISQYVLSLYPGLDYNAVLETMHSYIDARKETMSGFMFKGYTHHNELPSQLAAVTGLSFVAEGTLGELRDFNRHRAWGRFMQHIPLYYGLPMSFSNARDILNQGYGEPLYLTIPDFKELETGYLERMNNYYRKTREFLDNVHALYGDIPDSHIVKPNKKGVNYSFMLNLLPLGHRSNLWMHGNPKQAHYLSKLRVRPGGHINYRVMAYDSANLLLESDPYLLAIGINKKPNPADRNEFFSRS